MPFQQRGFTLIELMIVVAIIGILASIASVQYQQYTIKTKVMAAFSEIATGQINFQTRINEGDTSSAPAQIGLLPSTENCTITVTATSISCALVNTPAQLVNTAITLNYNAASDIWACTASGIASEYQPKSCI